MIGDREKSALEMVRGQCRPEESPASRAFAVAEPDVRVKAFVFEIL